MKITDNSMARALEWKPTPWNKPMPKKPKLGKKPLRPQDAWFWCRKGGETTWSHNPPPYTTSLDAITAEIEARGLYWGMSKQAPGEGPGYYAQVESHWAGTPRGKAASKTSSLALCAALLNYLQTTKRPARKGKL